MHGMVWPANVKVLVPVFRTFVCYCSCKCLWLGVWLLVI